MPRLSIASIPTATPMGPEAYQRQIIQRATQALGAASAERWDLRHLVVRSLRSPLPGNRRIPMSAVVQAPPAIRRTLGRVLYGTDAVTHRMSLELPPAPHGDVITLHDVISWRYPDESEAVRAARAEARRADAVICVSEFTAREAERVLGVRSPHVIYNGVDERYFAATPLSASPTDAQGLPERYVLHLGGASTRKNLEALAEAWPRVRRERPDIGLALAGPPHPRRTRLFDGMPGVVLLGRLADEAMPGLVAGASAVVIPSLYEGFGMPVLEAFAAGVPVVAARTSALPEVVGDVGLLVTPDAEGIASGLLDATVDGSPDPSWVTTAKSWARRFSWTQSALGHARVWASLG